MNTAVIFNQVMTLFILLAVGFIAKKTGIINEVVNKKLSELLLKVTSPALIFSSFIMEYQKEKMINAGIVMGLAIGMFFITIFFSGKLFFGKMDAGIKPILKSAIVFSNCGFMGFPIMASLFGQEGVFYASMYVAVFQFFLWTYGVIVFTGEFNSSTLKKALISPAMFAVYTGAIVFILRIPIPFPIKTASQMIGNMTTPLAMIIIGAIMADADIRTALKGWMVYIISFTRLIIIPLLGLGLTMLLPVPAITAKIFVILLSMPVAVNVAVFAEKFDKDALFASKLITVSTLFSIITIPLILLLV